MIVPLPFRVVYFSSEAPLNPATELELAVYTTRPATVTRGWASAPVCAWPQELGFEFERTTQLSSLALIAHAYMIPSRVEIHIGRRNGPQRPAVADGLAQYHKARFSKLGFVRFGENRESNFEAREQRTVRNISVRADFVRLVLHRCHENCLNLNEQVGLMAFMATGSQSMPSARNALSEDTFDAFERQSSAAVDSALHDLGLLELSMTPVNITDSAQRAGSCSADNIDTGTQQQCEVLRQQLRTAVDSEDYAQAGELKRAISRAEDVGRQLRELSRKMKLAAGRDDFDTSITLREEIRRLEILRDSISHRFAGDSQRLQNNCKTNSAVTWSPMVIQQSYSTVTNVMVVREALPTNATKSRNMNRQDSALKRRQFIDSIIADPLKEAVAKVLLVRSDLPRPETLDYKARAEADLFTGVFGRAAMDCFFSSNPELRALALRVATKALPSLEGSKLVVFKVTSALVLQALDDQVHTVRLEAVRLGITLFDNGEGGGTAAKQATSGAVSAWRRVTFDCASLPLQELLHGLRILLPSFFCAAGDDHECVQSEAISLIIYLRKQSYFGGDYIVTTQLTCADPAQNWLQLAGQSNVLKSLLALRGFSFDTGVQLSEAMAFTLTGIHHPHPRTKGAAMDALMEIYRIKGRKVDHYLADLDPSLLSILRNAFQEIDATVMAKAEKTFSDIDPATKSI